MEISVSKLKEFGSIYRVLYVEDDEVIRTQTVNFLARFFNHIDVAEDGLAGLEKYKAAQYDIVITDINMPHMNGIEMIEKIKEINEAQIVLVTSAYNDAENLLKLINLHIMRFVLKPFDFKKFLVVLYKIVEELDVTTKVKKIEDDLKESSKMAQSIVDIVDIGLVILEKGVLQMANRAFLEMYGFNDFATLTLEMPEIGALCQNFSKGICVESNADLIKELQTRPSEEHRIRTIRDGMKYEYQIKLSALNLEKESFILSFTDISDLQKYLTRDVHTQLPHHQAVLGEIDFLATTNSDLYAYFISLEHYQSVLKWYGKTTAIQTERELADKLKPLVCELSKGAFLGYFGTNQFLVLTVNNYDERIEEAIKQINFEHNKKIKESHAVGEKSFRLQTIVKKVKIDLNQPRDSIEVLIVNSFEELII